MSDIVERLRNLNYSTYSHNHFDRLVREASDEIERLRVLSEVNVQLTAVGIEEAVSRAEAAEAVLDVLRLYTDFVAAPVLEALAAHDEARENGHG